MRTLDQQPIGRGNAARLQRWSRAIAVLLALALCPLARAEFTDAEKAFLRDAQTRAARHVAAMGALITRTDQVDLDGALAPQRLTTPGGIAKARAAVGTYRAILAERRRLLARIYTESDAFFRTHSPSDAASRWAPRPFGLGKAAVMTLYNDLDRLETTYVDAVARLLDWCAGQHGSFGLENGELTFATQRDHRDFLRLATKVMAALARVNDGILAARAATDPAREEAPEKIRSALPAAAK